MNRKIITAGVLCLDITPVFGTQKEFSEPGELLAPGKQIMMKPADVSTGGCVANTGLALKFLGNDSVLMGKVGNDEFGDIVKRILKKHDVGGIITDNEGSTSYSVILAIPGVDRIFLHSAGGNDTFCKKDIPGKDLEGAAMFHFGYPPLMRRMYENDGAELESIFKYVKEKGISTSLDFAVIDPDSDAGRADWRLILKRVLPYVDFFVPSIEEVIYMLDRPKYERLRSNGGDMIDLIEINKDVIPYAEELLSMGCKAVLLKCGTRGMYLKTGDMTGIGENLEFDAEVWKNKEIYQPCFKAQAVRSATGAGDTSIAAFLTSVMLGKEPEKAVALAAAEGACAVTSYDALGGLKTIDELEEKLASGWELN